MKSGEAALPGRPKKTYQRPQLVTFGKIHSLVAGGTGTRVEGGAMINPFRRP